MQINQKAIKFCWSIFAFLKKCDAILFFKCTLKLHFLVFCSVALSDLLLMVLSLIMRMTQWKVARARGFGLISFLPIPPRVYTNFVQRFTSSYHLPLKGALILIVFKLLNIVFVFPVLLFTGFFIRFWISEDSWIFVFREVVVAKFRIIRFFTASVHSAYI